MKPTATPRPMGGFNQSFGNFSDEHLEQNAMQTALQQKQLSQQATSAAQSTTGGSALQMQQLAQQAGSAQAARAPVTPREVSSIKDELLKRPAQDIATQLKAFVDINALLGINPEKDDPQTQAKKKAVLNRWQKLDAEQKEIAQKFFQEKMQKKKQEQQEEEAKKQQKAQAEQQQLVMPSSPKKGPVGPGGSGKKAAVSKLEQDRKTLGGPKSAN